MHRDDKLVTSLAEHGITKLFGLLAIQINVVQSMIDRQRDTGCEALLGDELVGGTVP